MDAPFKNRAELDKFLSDAQREWVEASAVGFMANTSAGTQYSATSVRRSECFVGRTTRE